MDLGDAGAFLAFIAYDDADHLFFAVAEVVVDRFQVTAHNGHTPAGDDPGVVLG